MGHTPAGIACKSPVNVTEGRHALLSLFVDRLLCASIAGVSDSLHVSSQGAYPVAGRWRPHAPSRQPTTTTAAMYIYQVPDICVATSQRWEASTVIIGFRLHAVAHLVSLFYLLRLLHADTCQCSKENKVHCCTGWGPCALRSEMRSMHYDSVEESAELVVMGSLGVCTTPALHQRLEIQHFSVHSFVATTAHAAPWRYLRCPHLRHCSKHQMRPHGGHPAYPYAPRHQTGTTAPATARMLPPTEVYTPTGAPHHGAVV